MQTTQANVSSAASLTGFGAALTSTGASYVLAANSVGDSLAHKATILNKTVTDHSAKTVIITGTDVNDRPLVETMAMPGASATVTSTKFFKTVTSVVPSASTGVDTFDIGWAVASRGAWIVPRADVGNAPFNIGIGCTVVSGAPNFSLKYTYDAVGEFTHATITGKTANFDGAITTPCAAYWLEFTAAGAVTLTAIQAVRI